MKTTSEGTISKIALVFFLAFPACPTVANRELPKLTTSEKMAWLTYAIATEKGLGTSVIVNREDPSAPGGIVPVLVTCAHVLAAAPRGPYFLVLRMPVQGAYPAIAMLRIDVPPNSVHPYVAHPRRDVAAMETRLPPDVGHIISIASYSSGSQTDLEKYLIHTNVYSGDSGGPVFAARSRGTLALLGLVSERIGPKAGEVPLAVAIDSTVIRETLALLPRNRIVPGAGAFDRRLDSRTSSAPTLKLVGSHDLLKKSHQPEIAREHRDETRTRKALRSHITL